MTAPEHLLPDPWDLPPGTVPPGRWRVKVYGSGSTVVSSGRDRRTTYGRQGIGPHLDVDFLPPERGPDGEDVGEVRARRRRGLGEELARLLNGEPVELVGFERHEHYLAVVHPDGRRALVTGPHVDAEPPSCRWVEDDHRPARDAREDLFWLLLVALRPDPELGQARQEGAVGRP